MLVCDSITAILLYAQFSILRSRAILVIASGYVFTALILIPYALEFPGLFVPGGLLGGNVQSAATIYVIWHCGFPLFVIAYAFAKGVEPARRTGRARRAAAIVTSVVLTAAIVVLATVVCIAGRGLSASRRCWTRRASSPQWPIGRSA
jgi:hypothetical protein